MQNNPYTSAVSRETNRREMTDWKTFDAWEDGLLGPFELEGATVTQTCWACPEAYDVFLGEERIGYMRLRGGHFYAVFPDVGGEVVYDHRFDDPWQGCFSPEERQHHLPAAVKALIKKHERVAAEEMGQRFIKSWHDAQRKEK